MSNDFALNRYFFVFYFFAVIGNFHFYFYRFMVKSPYSIALGIPFLITKYRKGGFSYATAKRKKTNARALSKGA